MSVDVSVVVPTYNTGAYLQACVDGLTAQTLPTDRFEVIFVDDGSTDGETPARLDELAATLPNVRVFHEPNSGWPGRPRNVGTDAARGDYVFYCDHDDWLGPEALERMVAYARENDADVLIGKMVGHARGVPSRLFERNRPRAFLGVDPLMTSLTPHKLFRTAFLREHGIRFPEGRRRLEDHVFVVASYLQAQSISVLSDYPCYHHIRRPDEGNAAFAGSFDPVGYYGNLREVLDVIDAHLPPGPVRDGVLERPFRQEMLGRLSRRQTRQMSEDTRAALFDEVRKLAAERFPVDFGDRFGPSMRARAAALAAGDRDAVEDIADRADRAALSASVTGVEWTGAGWRVGVECRVVHRDDGDELSLRQVGDDAWEVDDRLVPGTYAGRPSRTDEVFAAAPDAVLVNRKTDEEWYLPADGASSLVAAGDGRFHLRGTVELDVSPATLAGGRSLDDGYWDLYLLFGTWAGALRTRLPLTEDQLAEPSVAVLGPRPSTVAAYRSNSGELAFDVGQRKHTLVDALLRDDLGVVEPAGGRWQVPVTTLHVGDGAAPRPLDLLVLSGSGGVLGRVAAQVAADGRGPVLRGDAAAVSRRGSSGAVPPGRYAVGASSRKRDEPQLVGEVVLGRNGVRSLDLRPPRRVNPPDLTAAERAGHLARGAARRARRLLGG